MARVIETRKSRKSRVLLPGLVLAHLAVISHQLDGSGGHSLLQQFVFNLLTPLQRGVVASINVVSGTWSGYVHLRGVSRENRQLQDRLHAAETLLQESREEAREAKRLREIIQVRETLPFDTIVAGVIAQEGVPWFRTIVLNKGLSDGIALNAPVLSPSGVVGRVIYAGPAACKVQLILDRDCGVGARIERSRITGVISGQVTFADSGTTDLVMKYVPALADVVVGDVVVTSGLDHIYPKGLVIGRVLKVSASSALFKDILVAPSARFDRIEEVMIVRGRVPEPVFTESVR